MAEMGRPGISSENKRLIWQLWRNGTSLSDIGRTVDKHAGSIFGVLKLKGGITPAARVRRQASLTLDEREEISRGISSGESVRYIANRLFRSPSTVSREINRNGRINKYRAIKAEKRYWDKAARPKQCILLTNQYLCGIVEEKIAADWSPEQVSGWLKLQFPSDGAMHISHETIYRTLFIQARGALKKELLSHLRSHRIIRHGKAHTTKGISRGIIDAESIRKRPPEAQDLAISGHWEGDLITGSGNTHIATLVERKSRYTILVQVDGKDTESVVDALIREVKNLPEQLRETLTWDRGMELADHKRFTIHTDMKVYFCDPGSPWQRGTNENTNRLLRQYFPKKTSLSEYDQNYLNRIAKKLNERPRKTLNYLTPADILKQSVALTT
jgi:IS30 family transposase